MSNEQIYKLSGQRRFISLMKTNQKPSRIVEGKKINQIFFFSFLLKKTLNLITFLNEIIYFPDCI